MKLKASLCSRRSGKSFGAGLWIAKEAGDNPDTPFVYIAKTRDSAEKIFWRPILKRINKMLNLNIHFNEQKLLATWPNGATCQLVGTDSSYDDMTKLLGQAFRVAIIDEASKYTIADVEQLIFDILKPAMADYGGTIAMIGTPDDYVNSYFAQVTQGKVPGWSVHEWTALDNPHMKKQFQQEIDEHYERDPNVHEQAWFQQNYMKKWVVDSRNLIYKHGPDNIVKRVPENQYSYALGVQISPKGYTSFALCGYTASDRSAYIPEAYQIEGSDLNRCIEEIEQIKLRYGDDLTNISIVDPSNKLAPLITQRYSLAVHNINLKEKTAWLQLFTTELKQGFIKVLGNDCKDLLDEFATIIRWAKKPKELIEDPAVKNVIATAALYAWSNCHAYNATQPITYEDPNDEWWEAEAERIKSENNNEFDF